MSGDIFPEYDVEADEFDLASLQTAYAEAEVEEREFDEVPDGKYQVRVLKAEMGRSQTSGNSMLKWTLKILGPKYAGRLLWRNSMMIPESMKWLKTDLEICGVVLSNINELPSRLNDLLDVGLEVSKRTRGDSESIYINRRIVIDETPSGTNDSALAPF